MNIEKATVKNSVKPLINGLALGSLVAASSVSVSACTSSDTNPFAAKELSSGYEASAKEVQKKADAKCGEGKCGGEKSQKKADAKCGEGKCGSK